MTKYPSHAILTVFLCGVSTLATAEPLTITIVRAAMADAFVDAGTGRDSFDGQFGGDLVSARAVASDRLYIGVGASTLGSEISSDARRITGAGTGNALVENPGAGTVSGRGYTLVQWGFRLDEPHLFHLLGAFATSPPHRSGEDDESIGSWQASLQSGLVFGGDPESAIVWHSGEASGTVSERGRLAPGLYLLDVETMARVRTEQGAGTAGVDSLFSLTLTAEPAPVPEPGSVALVITGFVAGGVVVWRRAHAAKLR